MRQPPQESDNRPPWDRARAEALLGATVLVGVTHNELAGERMEQVFGTVTHTDPERGVTLKLEGSRSGETFTLPPDLRAFFPAAPGSYRLRETGEVIVDPDYATTWTFTSPIQ